MRSRERKKLHVRDLEIKSRYLEGECRRLDRLLQCFIAENHALRLSLQRGNAFGVTSAKQESAVLLLGMFHSPYCSLLMLITSYRRHFLMWEFMFCYLKRREFVFIF